MSVRDKIKNSKKSEYDDEEELYEEEVYEDEESSEDEVVEEKLSTRDRLKNQKESNKSKDAGARSKVVRVSNNGQKEKFKRIKMWVSYLISMSMKDRGKIPDNIGNRILITNNLYITKLYMSSIIHIHELGDNTVETFIEVLNTQLRKRGNSAILDFTMKNKKYVYDNTNSGLKSRIAGWENTLDSPVAYKRLQERAARCLYTVEQAESGKQLKETRMYLIIRAKTVVVLNSAEKIIYDCLAQMGCTYIPCYANVKETVEYISIIGNYANDIKDVASVMTSNQVLSQLLPNTGSYNDRTGLYCGQNIRNGSPYFIDPSLITVARNMYCVAPSGVGKTVLAVNMASSAFENGSACCFMDIKGNEYNAFIEATGGYIVSLRPSSIEFINSWVMNADDTNYDMAEQYFKSRINFSKQQIIILSGIRDRSQLVEFEELLDEFHDSLYVSIGAVPTNMNSWAVTKQLNPYTVYDMFENYLKPAKRAQYNISKSMMGTLKMYMSVTGSKSYVFKKEFEYSKILASPTLSFDFGILQTASSSDIDIDLFRLKFLYMSKLNGDYVTRQYQAGRRTFKVLEESQIVSDEVMEMYVQEYTLRRSQNQDTLLLGNSVQALMSKDISKPIIENTRGLFIGELGKEARLKVIEEFGLQNLERFIKIPGSSNKYKNCFMFVNNMEPRTLYPIIKVVMDPELGRTKPKYKVLVPTKESNVMAGK